MGPVRPRLKTVKRPATSPGVLLEQASVLLQTADFDLAGAAAEKALEMTGPGGNFELHALSLLGMIKVEQGEQAAARRYLIRAVALDEDGRRDDRIGGGIDKFLWLAQLSETGGRDSVSWYERGAAALRARIRDESDLAARDEAQRKLAGVLCAVAEVYMTDLSWEPDAEQQCDGLVTEAALVAPELAETWQTVANVRISQQRPDDARAALARNLALWQALPPDHIDVPDFAARISLARLLLEVAMRNEALTVLRRLVQENDQSVEAWYLGGWGFFLQAESQRANDEDAAVWKKSWTSSRRWLAQCLQLFERQQYEDSQLAEHATELLGEIAVVLGHPIGPDANGEPDDAWEDSSGLEDEDEGVGQEGEEEDDDDDEGEEDKDRGDKEAPGFREEHMDI